jgi:hypothetical protein
MTEYAQRLAEHYTSHGAADAAHDLSHGTGSFGWAASGVPTSTFFSGLVYQTVTTSVHFRGDVVRAGLNHKFYRSVNVLKKNEAIQTSACFIARDANAYAPLAHGLLRPARGTRLNQSSLIQIQKKGRC